MQVEPAGPPFWRSFGRSLWRALEGRRRLSKFNIAAQRHASERSRQLLLGCLNTTQRAEFERTRAFRVRGQSGQWYRIGYGTIANIEVLGERGELRARLCARPNELPTPAVMLAQKLMLETREAEFLRIAASQPVLIPTRGLGETIRA